MKAQELLKKNTWDRQIDDREPYIFSGLMVCGICGRNLGGGRSTMNKKIYRCMRHFNNNQCPNNHTKTETLVEKYLLENITNEWDKHKMTLEAQKAKSTPKKSNRKEIEKKMQRLNELYINGFIEMEKYKADYESLQNQIVDEDAAQEPKFDTRSTDKILSGNFKDAYASLSCDEKKAFWRGILKAIYFDGENLSVEFN